LFDHSFFKDKYLLEREILQHLKKMRDDDKTIVWSVGGLEELSHLPYSIYIKP